MGLWSRDTARGVAAFGVLVRTRGPFAIVGWSGKVPFSLDPDKLTARSRTMGGYSRTQSLGSASSHGIAAPERRNLPAAITV